MPRGAKQPGHSRPATVDHGKYQTTSKLKDKSAHDTKSISFVNDSEDDNAENDSKQNDEQKPVENESTNSIVFNEERKESDDKNSDTGSDSDGDILNDDKWDTDIEEENTS